jgi:hypothetical protein
MKLFARFSIASMCAVAALAAVPATAQMDPMAPPKVLTIIREYTKPGKSGTMHEKTESAYVKAMQAAKWPSYYIAMNSMSGPDRTLFVTAYDSFSAWQKDMDGMDKNAALSAALDHAGVVDGELLAATDEGAFVLRPEMSGGPGLDVAKMRYFDIQMFKIKPGHDKEWDELVKIYKDAFAKAAPEISWATYQSAYGANNGGEFLVITPLKSLAEVDKSFSDNGKVMAAMGAAGQKRMAELTAACLDSTQDNLFHFNPKMSYSNPHFLEVDPDFWKPKPVAAPKAAAPAKP